MEVHLRLAIPQSIVKCQPTNTIPSTDTNYYPNFHRKMPQPPPGTSYYPIETSAARDRSPTYPHAGNNQGQVGFMVAIPALERSELGADEVISVKLQQ
jgi:hypothetical protein